METFWSFSISPFSWFFYAAFTGLAVSLRRFSRPVAAPFIVTGILIVVPVMLMLINRDFFIYRGTTNRALSILAFMGFGIALRSLRFLPSRRTGVASFICCGALCACVFWGFVDSFWGIHPLFLPQLFLPELGVIPAHLAFVVFFAGTVAVSWRFFAWTWKREGKSPASHGKRMLGVYWLIRFFVVLKMLVVTYCVSLFLTTIFGWPSVRHAAIKAMALPALREGFQDITGKGAYGGGFGVYECFVNSFIPFVVESSCEWNIDNIKPELTRGL